MAWGGVGDVSDSLTQRFVFGFFWHAWDAQCNLQHIVKLHKSEHSEHVANEKLLFFLYSPSLQDALKWMQDEAQQCA